MFPELLLLTLKNAQGLIKTDAWNLIFIILPLLQRLIDPTIWLRFIAAFCCDIFIFLSYNLGVVKICLICKISFPLKVFLLEYTLVYTCGGLSRVSILFLKFYHIFYHHFLFIFFWKMIYYGVISFMRGILHRALALKQLCNNIFTNDLSEIADLIEFLKCLLNFWLRFPM